MKNLYKLFLIVACLISCEKNEDEFSSELSVKINNLELESFSDTLKTSIKKLYSSNIEFTGNLNTSYKLDIKLLNVKGTKFFIDNIELSESFKKIGYGKHDISIIPDSTIETSLDEIKTDNFQLIIKNPAGKEIKFNYDFIYFSNLSPLINVASEIVTDKYLNQKEYTINFKQIKDRDYNFGGSIKEYIFIVNNNKYDFTKKEAKSLNYTLRNTLKNNDEKLTIQIIVKDSENAVSKKIINLN